MDLYSIALFVHIVGALLLFVLLTIEGVALRVGFSSAQLNRIIGPVSALAILVPGVYMMKAQWGFAGWVVVGITAWVLIAAAGAYTGVSVMRGRMSKAAARVSWLVRIWMAVAVVFDMTVKPNVLVAVVIVIAGALLGAAVNYVRRREVAST
jgi:hypothetical protein